MTGPPLIVLFVLRGLAHEESLVSILITVNTVV